MSQGTFDETTPIIRAAEPHMAMLFLIDVSDSMNGTTISKLNESINKFKDQICTDRIAAEILDVAIVTFNHETQVVMPFTPVTDMEPVNLVASGGTEIATAVQVALDMIDERCRFYRCHAGTEPYKPWVFMISDGYGGDVSAVSKLIRQKEKDGFLKFCALGVEGYDSKTLHQLCGDKVLKLDGYDFTGFFDWISWGRESPYYPDEPNEDPNALGLPDNIPLDIDDWWFD